EGLENLQAKLDAPDTKYPLVMKADGLAGGKGAAVVRDRSEAESEINRMFASGALPEDPRLLKVVIEEFLEGKEVSAIAFTDGRTVAMMPPACDYKRLLDGDQGPLTGGMGAYSPTNYVTGQLWQQVKDEIMVKTVN